MHLECILAVNSFFFLTLFSPLAESSENEKTFWKGRGGLHFSAHYTLEDLTSFWIGIKDNLVKSQCWIFHQGTEFVVPFSSRSHSLALKSSLKSHQMTTLFVQNDKVFTQMMMFSLKPLFWTKKFFISWLFNDNLRARERDREERKNQKFCA